MRYRLSVTGNFFSPPDSADVRVRFDENTILHSADQIAVEQRRHMRGTTTEAAFIGQYVVSPPNVNPASRHQIPAASTTPGIRPSREEESSAQTAPASPAQVQVNGPLPSNGAHPQNANGGHPRTTAARHHPTMAVANHHSTTSAHPPTTLAHPQTHIIVNVGNPQKTFDKSGRVLFESQDVNVREELSHSNAAMATGEEDEEEAAEEEPPLMCSVPEHHLLEDKLGLLDRPRANDADFEKDKENGKKRKQAAFSVKETR